MVFVLGTLSLWLLVVLFLSLEFQRVILSNILGGPSYGHKHFPHVHTLICTQLSTVGNPFEDLWNSFSKQPCSLVFSLYRIYYLCFGSLTPQEYAWLPLRSPFPNHSLQASSSQWKSVTWFTLLGFCSSDIIVFCFFMSEFLKTAFIFHACCLFSFQTFSQVRY